MLVCKLGCHAHSPIVAMIVMVQTENRPAPLHSARMVACVMMDKAEKSPL